MTGRRQLRWIAWGTALGACPFAFGYALPWALGVDSVAAAGAHRDSARPRAAGVRVGDRPLPPAGRRSHRQARARLHGGARRDRRRSTSALLQAGRRSVRRATPTSTTGSSRCSRRWSSCCWRQPVKDAVQNALDRAFYRDRYDYRRALVGFARDLNSDLDVDRLSQRLVDARRRDAGRRSHGADAAPTRRARRLRADRATRASPMPLPRAVARARRWRPRLDGGHTVALDDPIAARALRRRRGRVLARRGHLLLRAVRLRRTARSRCSRSAARRATSRSTARTWRCSTAVAGQVATAIENGRLYRQLHLKAEELERMREFNENILESLDDGLVVFDCDERIVRWNRALEELYGVPRADGDRPAARRGVRRAVRRGAARGAPRASRRRDALSRAAARRTRRRRRAALLVNAPWCRCRRRRRGRRDRRHDPAHRGHHRRACSSKSSCRSRRRWRRSACSRPASRTR